MFEKCARSSPSSRQCHISTAEGTGTIGAVELQAAANAQKQMQQANKFLKFAVGVLLMVVFVLISFMFISAEVSKDTRPNAAGIATMTSGGGKPMAVASVKKEVKLKDLWKPEYSVIQLEGMNKVLR